MLLCSMLSYKENFSDQVALIFHDRFKNGSKNEGNCIFSSEVSRKQYKRACQGIFYCKGVDFSPSSRCLLLLDIHKLRVPLTSFSCLIILYLVVLQ